MAGDARPCDGVDPLPGAGPTGGTRLRGDAALWHPGLIGFRIAATASAGIDWRRLDETWALVRVGAGHVILGLPATAAPNGLAGVAREVAEPLVGATRREGA